MRGALLPGVGDILRVKKPRKVTIAAFRAEGLKHQLTAPPLVRADLTAEDETGVLLPKGELLIVRDADTTSSPGRPPAIWARVAEWDAETDSCVRASRAMAE